ncbi:MAG: CotH kinase family protein [Lachnospiraceae bacterium]|nr:CotH kinase family protein [Lachnospiraceae bacterium]
MRKTGKRIWGIVLVLALALQFLPADFAAVEVKAAGDEDAVASPKFSKDSGNYDNAFTLTLTAEAGAKIYYSTDGSVPSPERMAKGDARVYEYTGPITVKDRTGEPNVLATPENAAKMAQDKRYIASDEQVAKSTVIRAMAVNGGEESPVVTKTYFVGTNQTTRYEDVVVLSLVTDPENLMDDNTGIFVTGNYDNYKQHGRDWEREAYADFYEEDGSIGFGYDIGIRVHGGYTRQYQQKSLNVYFREEYGQKNLKYELLPGAVNVAGEKMKKYKNFVLRSGGNDSLLTKTRDVYIQSRVSDRSMSTQAFRPCVVYLNGEYWGLYNIQEKYSDNWLEEEFGVNKDNVVIIKNGEVDEGNDGDIALLEELEALAELDMSQEENYQKFLDAVELQSYLDYYATEHLIGNTDWSLHQNNQFWRSRTVTDNKYEDGKWRWMLYDTEFSMNLYGGASGDTISKSDDPLFNALLKNPDFRRDFINTAMDLLNENLNYGKYNADYTAFTAFYATLMEEQNQRFGNDWGGTSMDAFNGSVQQFQTAWNGMASRVKSMLKTHLFASNTVKVSVSSDVAESITINTLTEPVKDGAWSGTYYQEAPIHVSAPAVEGYKFSNWEVTGGTAAEQTSAATDITLTGSNVSIQAVYEEAEEVTSPPEPSPGSDVTQTPDKQPDKQPEATPAPSPTPEPKPEVKAPEKAKIKKLTSPKKRQMKVRIKKQSADGFQIVYAGNKKFTKGKKKVYTKKNVKSFKKLKRGKRYYVKVRAYRKDAAGKRIFGKFSPVKKVKVK